MRVYAPCFLAVLLSLGQIYAYGQAPSYVFNQLSIKDGLSEGTVRAITEDKRGFMWFGTEDGLNKYDGYTFTVFKPDLQDSFSISSKFVKNFFNDSQGRLWIGTKQGVNIYDNCLDRFYNFNSDYYPALKHIKEEVEAIHEDKKGNFWLLTKLGLYKISSLTKAPQRFSAPVDPRGYLVLREDDKGDFYIATYKGLLKFNPVNNRFEDLSKVYGNTYIKDIYIDSAKNIWLATFEGLKYADLSAKSIKHYPHNPLNKYSISGNNSIRILPAEDKLFVAIDGNGIDLFDPATERFYHYTKESGSQLNSNNITSIFKDSKGTLWVGTFMNGINFSNINTNFLVTVKNSTSSQSVKSGVITHFLKDSRETFWISTDGGGIFFRKKGAEAFDNYRAETHPSVLKSNAAISLLEDRKKNIWVSTYTGGLTRIAPDGKATIFQYDPKNPSSIIWDKINALTEYRDEIWVSSYGMGVCVYNEKTGKFRPYKYNPEEATSIASGWSFSFLEDSRGTLWIATHDGLCKYLPESDQFKTYTFNKKSKLSDKNYVFDIYEDSEQRLWVGSNGSGLLLFDRDKETFTAYTTREGLSDDAVKTIMEDNRGHLWLATNNGLTKFSLQTRKSLAYTRNDGIAVGSFSFNSKYKDREGKIYFGTNEGYVIIDPALSIETTAFPKVVLTEFRIFNVPVSPREDSAVLKSHITETKEITLSYDQNSVSFEFAALNFNIPKHNYYSYMLEGFDKGWIYTGKNREAKYTNLDPGEYTFKVRATNNEKAWSKETTELRIVIRPPFWQTWWFKSLSMIVALSLVAGFVYIRTRAIRYRNKWLQDQVQERTMELQETNLALKEQSATVLDQRKELLDKKYILEKNNEKLSEYNEFQQKLIAIIAHDIRGPLQRFSNLLHVVDESTKDFVIEKLKENANELSLFATDLLSWVSLQSSKAEIENKKFSMREAWEKAVKEIEQFREEKKISISVTHHKAGEYVYGAAPVMLASIRNILSNAIKFSETGGMIEVETGIVKGNYSAVRITDFGKGFDATEINKLIGGESFKGMRSQSIQNGAGLGMTICNDMMKKSGGYIEAASLPGSGATFYIYLPLAIQPVGLKNSDIEKEFSLITKERLRLVKDKKVVLVDDDDELRWAMIKFLGKYLTVYEMRSGEEASEWLKENTPDLALLDIRMNGMSGIDLCRKIKGSKDSAHVPCLIISGEAGENIRKEVFNAGADSFLLKPLNSEEVLLQIIVYFENQEKLIQRFFTEDLPVDSLSQNAFNKAFLEKVVGLIESNLGSPDLTVEFLANEAGLSKSTLYRNLKSLTGQSANSFIKNIRMRRSLLLLKEGKLNISEVSAEMGFNSPSYFTTTFKKHFGFSPTKLKVKGF